MAEVKEKEELRVTTLVGAGAALEITGMKDHHSTSAITRSVLNPQPQHGLEMDNYAAQVEVANVIFNHLWKEYNQRHPEQQILTIDEAYKYFHFEILFHVIETLYSYDYFWRGTSKNEKDRPALVDFIKNVLDISWEKLSAGYKSYITTIMDVVNEYDTCFVQKIDAAENVWYKNWWCDAPFKWDVFTLNYDTTIENSLTSYEDGFEPINNYNFKRFNLQNLVNSSDHSINHLHGCILYGTSTYKREDTNIDCYTYGSKDLYKHPSFDKSIDCWIGRWLSDDEFQSKERELFTPIITGLRKTDKLLHLPLDAYRWNFERRMMQNNAMVITGYSFGDTYINEVLERMRLYHGDRCRVVIIDYWPLEDEYEMEDIDKLKNFIWNKPQNKGMVHLILKVAQEGMFEGDIFKQIQRGQFVSRNGQLMLFVRGFRHAAQYKNEIYNFLQS